MYNVFGSVGIDVAGTVKQCRDHLAEVVPVKLVYDMLNLVSHNYLSRITRIAQINMLISADYSLVAAREERSSKVELQQRRSHREPGDTAALSTLPVPG